MDKEETASKSSIGRMVRQVVMVTKGRKPGLEAANGAEPSKNWRIQFCKTDDASEFKPRRKIKEDSRNSPLPNIS